MYHFIQCRSTGKRREKTTLDINLTSEGATETTSSASRALTLVPVSPRRS
jgi:hypothetical protein